MFSSGVDHPVLLLSCLALFCMVWSEPRLWRCHLLGWFYLFYFILIIWLFVYTICLSIYPYGLCTSIPLLCFYLLYYFVIISVFTFSCGLTSLFQQVERPPEKSCYKRTLIS